jgi:7-keto-8-aminopelargonate synthetase-like enzyme
MIFSAAPPPASVAAALATVDIMDREPERRARLWDNTRFFAEGLRSLGLNTGESQTPVVPIVVGEDLTALMMVQRLHEEGVFVNCVLSPATPPGRALIRTSLMATHTREQLARALDAIEKVGRQVGLVRAVPV